MTPELHPAPVRRKRPRATQTRAIALFLGAHVVLGVLMRVIPPFATIHALVCILMGLVVAATRRPRDIAYVVAYITGSEVLWRMTRAAVFHESGKYAIAAVLLIALTRFRARRNRGLALAYLILLLPSAALTFAALEPAEARQALSFNLCGPLALSLCIIFFSNLRLTREDIRGLFWALMGPVIGISTIVFFSTAAVRETIKFGRESNFATSGGFGPNQVSAILGLALMFAVLMLIDRKQRMRIRIALVGLAGIFAIQAALTFSRGGIILAAAGVVMASAYLLRTPRARISVLGGAAVLGLLGNYVIAPQLEDFTHGKLAERYAELDTNGRTKIASIDLQIFEDNPVLGVGPGVALELRGEMGHRGVAHTEFTRLLSEHGILGVIAIILLLVLGIRTLRAAQGNEARAFVLAMLTWVTLFLGINAMRLVAPCFLFGLACSISLSSIPPKAPRTKPA